MHTISAPSDHAKLDRFAPISDEKCNGSLHSLIYKAQAWLLLSGLKGHKVTEAKQLPPLIHAAVRQTLTHRDTQSNESERKGQSECCVSVWDSVGGGGGVICSQNHITTHSICNQHSWADVYLQSI